jgi:hypothetical protein
MRDGNLNKEKQWKNGKKLKGTASSSNQRCKGYITFNVIIVVLRHELKFSPGSAIRCYSCWEDDCKDPYTAKTAHIRNCTDWATHCVKADSTYSKWFHNGHFNIYIKQSHKISQYI